MQFGEEQVRLDAQARCLPPPWCHLSRATRASESIGLWLRARLCVRPQVKQWRRSYDIPPPPVEEGSEHDPKADPLYAAIDADCLPSCECLKDTVARCLPLCVRPPRSYAGLRACHASWDLSAQLDRSPRRLSCVHATPLVCSPSAHPDRSSLMRRHATPRLLLPPERLHCPPQLSPDVGSRAPSSQMSPLTSCDRHPPLQLGGADRPRADGRADGARRGARQLDPRPRQVSRRDLRGRDHVRRDPHRQCVHEPPPPTALTLPARASASHTPSHRVPTPALGGQGGGGGKLLDASPCALRITRRAPNPLLCAQSRSCTISTPICAPSVPTVRSRR
jgi:hypothetical protein